MKHHFLIFLTLLMLGFGAGFINGLLGAAGGILIVLGLKVLTRGRIRDPRSVYASAIAVMLPLSLLSVLQYVQRGSLPLSEALPLLLPAVAGGLVGALLLRRLSARLLSRIFAAVVLISGVVMAV